MPTRLENLRNRKADLEERLGKIARILDKENPEPVSCENSFVPNCRQVTRIGGYQGHDALVRVTYADQREDRQRIVLCDRCALFLYQEECIATEPARYFFENMMKERKGQLRGVEQDIEYTETKERLSEQNKKVLAGFKKKPVQEGGDEEPVHRSTLAEAARVKKGRKGKGVSPHNGAATQPEEPVSPEQVTH